MWWSGLQKIGQGVKRIEAVLQRMFPSSSVNEKVGNVKALTEAYHKYKREYVKHLSFIPEGENLGKFILLWYFHDWFQPQCWSMPHWRQCTSTLTRQRMMRLRGMRRYRLCFTLCVRSERFWHLKVTMEAQLGLIGGTMGLLTGFSILSGVEIIYYLLRFHWFSVINLISLLFLY